MHPFLHPRLTSSLHTFESCCKSVHKVVISFSTFCQSHWQESWPRKFLHKEYRYFEDWKTILRTYCLSAPLVGGMFLMTLLSLENRIRPASFTSSLFSVVTRCKVNPFDCFSSNVYPFWLQKKQIFNFSFVLVLKDVLVNLRVGDFSPWIVQDVDELFVFELLFFV